MKPVAGTVLVLLLLQSVVVCRATMVTNIAAGYTHSLLLKADGSVWSFGNNSSGQLGDGRASNTNRPEQIVSEGVTAIAAGYYHGLLLKSDGSLWSMGYNFYGQLGSGSRFPTNRPIQIVPNAVTAIACGSEHSLFLKSDGSLWGMGYNHWGQLGDGTINDTNAPEQIVSDGVVAIAAGGSHSLFVKSDGSLWAMGYNPLGALGDGTFTMTNQPEKIVADGVVAIAGGSYYSLFVKSDGSLWAMGDDYYGQLGDGNNVLKNGLGMSADEMHTVFKEWNAGELESYLIEITRDILAFKDTDGQPLVEHILDTSGQKGTGKWTVQSSADLGIPITLIAEAVYSRCVSALKDERVKAARKLKGPKPLLPQSKKPEAKKEFIDNVRDALYASKIISYAQGYMLMRAAAAENKWNLNYGGIALMWRGGCIIRSRFLGKIKEAYDKNAKLTNLLLDDYFRGEIKRCQKGWRNVVSAAFKRGIPVPAFSTALSFYDSYRSAQLPANLLQAQRDYFGAHTYERIDKPRGEFFHTNWTGRGGTTASGSYTV